MIIIGEKINTSIKSARKIVEARDSVSLKELALLQSNSGANYLDVNVSTENEEAFDRESMEWAINTIQEAVDTPLTLDSPDPGLIEVGLRKCKGKVMINSVTAEEEKLKAILPLVKEFNAEVIALPIRGGKMPESVDDRLSACEVIADEASRFGISLDRIYFDPLAMAIATDTTQGKNFVEALRQLKIRFPGARTTVGLSNLSFGLPCRTLINRCFLVMAIEAGLDSAIADPTDKRLMSVLRTTEMILGKDEYCMNYLRSYKKGELQC
ncbi:dihydropteroate synthase [Chloroflexota bacterium]